MFCQGAEGRPERGVGSDVAVTTLQSLVNSSNIATEKKAYGTSDSAELNQIFKDLASQLTSVDARNVTISDKLSDYAELTDNATFALKVTNGEGKAVDVSPASVTREAASDADGATASFRSGDENVQVTIKYDDANMTFTVEFPDDYVLDNSWTYTVTTQIQPTETAYNAGEDGYSATGDQGTDAPGNSTSSGQLGFHSNDAATLTYESAGQTVTDDYPNPVIQVHAEEVSGVLQVLKSLEGEDLRAKQFEFRISAVDPETDGTSTVSSEFAGWGATTVRTFLNGDEVQSSIPLVHTGSDLTFNAGDINQKYAYIYEEVEGNDSNYTYDKTAWKVVVFVERNDDDELVPYAQVYKDADGKDTDGVYEWDPCNTDLEPITGEGAQAARIELKQTEGNPAITITFNNALKRYGLQIKKNVIDGDGNVIQDALPGAYFAIYSETVEDGKYTEGEDERVSGLYQNADLSGNEMTDTGFGTAEKGMVSFYGLKLGTYWVVEVKTPSGCTLAEPKKLVIAKDADTGEITVEYNGTRVNPAKEGNNGGFDEENGLIQVTVSNKKIAELPTSGSSGTLVLGSMGTAAIIVAGVYLANRKYGFIR